MFDTKKTLIVVYKDELLINQLKKMVDTSDDDMENVIGTKDNSINIVSWTEKVWLGNKKAGNIQGKILFLGRIKGTDKLIPIIDVKFDECGVKYGWAGNQAVLFVEPRALTNQEGYEEFLEKFSDLPVPESLKTMKEEAEEGVAQDAVEHSHANDHVKQPKAPASLGAAWKAIETATGTVKQFGAQVAARAETKFREKAFMERQMLFYGVVQLYNNDLESFVNQ